MKRLYRTRNGQMIGGVCMGLARYFDIDVTIVRLLFVLLGFMGGSGVPIYIIAWIIISEEQASGEAVDVTPGSTGEGARADNRTIGLIVVAIGAFLLMRQIMPRLYFNYYLWPILLIGFGIYLMLGGFRGGKR